MTAELARPGGKLPVMDRGPDPVLLGRRLERLRAGAAGGAGATSGAGAAADTAVAAGRPLTRRWPSTADRAWDRAALLATAFGGRVLETANGPLAAVDSQVPLPIERSALARLPYNVDGQRPLVCLDLETTGLGTAVGTVPFMVGVGIWRGPSLVVRQLILPDHADEPALLSALQAAIPAEAWLVSYNGLGFDWPLLVARFRLHRRDPPVHAGHLDLLPVARQLWKHRLGNARLATVERVAGVRRLEDLPGALVPERYFRYLRDGRPEPLREVLAHNRQDVISLGLLLRVLSEQLGRHERWPELHPGDLAGLARGYNRQGRRHEALACLDGAVRPDTGQFQEALAVSLQRQVAAERARLLGRLGRRDEAGAAWLELAHRGGPGAAMAWIHVARHREHARRDAAGALAASEQAAAIAVRARAWGRPLIGVERDLRHRLARLRRKQLAARFRSDDPRRTAA